MKLVDGDWIETKDQDGSDYRLLQVSNIGVGSFRETGNFRWITNETFHRLRCTRILPGDILIARMPDPTGRAWFVEGLPWPAVTSVDVAIASPDPVRVDGRFLAYYLNSSFNLAYAQVRATGTTRERIPRRVLGQFVVPVPPIGDQRKIAAVLAAYDQLIENNLRRIEILEEMAQAIYREWFVNFRYPGHEADALVDSPLGPIPEGWRVVAFGSIASGVSEGVVPSDLEQDTRYVGLEHIPRLSFTLLNHGSASEVTSRKWRFSRGDILFGKLRPYFHKVAEAAFEGVCSTDAIVIRPQPEHRDLALQVAFSPEFVAHAVATSGGTDRPRASWADLATFELALPPDTILRAFSPIARSMVDLAANLAVQNANLRVTRDLLLPKLISGDIDVSDLDIDTSWLVA